MRIGKMGERGLVKELRRMLRRDPKTIVGIGDDAAVLPWTKKKHLLLASDMVIEGVHFTRRRATPFQIGWKAMARNVSDIAAMGGVPRYALVSAGLDPALPVSYARELMRGMEAVAKRFAFSIVGGDTSRSKKLVIDVSIAGEVAKKDLVLRSGARTGDLVFVTGSIGGSRRGTHLTFTPRLAEARTVIRRCKVSAMIDVSDGLLLDLSRLCVASGVGVRLFKNAIPVDPAARSFDGAVREGEDFELVFTMSVPQARRFCATVLPKMKTSVTLIGVITNKRHGYILSTPQGDRRICVQKSGFLHF